LITGKLFVLYGYEFVALTADTFTDPKSPECKAVNKRAKKLLLRGRDYVLKGLDLRHPGIMAGIKSGDLNSALAKTTPADTEYLFWAGCAWAAAIGSDRSDLGLAMNANRATALLDKVLQSNENYSNGAVHEIFIPLCAALPLSLGGGEKAARDHFTKAVSCSEGKKAGPYVALATSVALKKNDRKEFTDLLEKALAVDCNSLPEYRLQNTISIERARRLLDHADRLF